MQEGSSRRGFLRAFLRESARTVQEASEVLNGPAKPRGDAPARPVTRRGPELERARAAARTATSEELDGLVADLGLEDRLADIRGLAAHSVRLTSPTLADPPTGSWLAAPAEGLLDEADWPLWNGERLALVAQLDLTDPAVRDADLPLPAGGRLLFLYAALQAPSGEPGAARVLHVHPEGLAPQACLSVELTLPRVWSEPVQRLELDPLEHDGYLKLRRRLAALQDVELDDGFGPTIAYHRALGYPTDPEAVVPPGRRLLLQLTVDEAGPWNLGGDGGRLCFWIGEEDLRAGEFSGVTATAKPWEV